MELERIKRCAELSVKRGISFALLAVGCVVVGYSWDPLMAFQVGAGGTLLLAVLLYFRAHDAPTRDYRRTETWILLDKKLDLPPDRVQATIGQALRELYRRYANWLLIASLTQWAGSLVVRVT